ncbi:MAG: hypothetical protein ABSC95_04045 [Acetobacteraceae bacterium]
MDSPVQPCPLQHWFLEHLIRCPEPHGRPKWWPVERRPEAYAFEKLSITLAGVKPLQELLPDGTFSADGIPAGTAVVVHYAFYQDVQLALEGGVHF